MTISIVIPVYNVLCYLRQCVDCVLYQTYRRLCHPARHHSRHHAASGGHYLSPRLFLPVSFPKTDGNWFYEICYIEYVCYSSLEYFMDKCKRKVFT